MGEFTDIPGPAMSQQEEPSESQDEKMFETDVEGVMANDVVRQGTNEFPVFDCTEDEFYQNMSNSRKRLRFKSGSNAANYMSGSKYKRPFYIRTTTSNGETYVRKVK